MVLANLLSYFSCNSFLNKLNEVRFSAFLVGVTSSYAERINTQNTNASDMPNPTLQLIFALLAFVFVLCLAYFSIRIYAKSSLNTGFAPTKNMKILSVLKLSYTSQLLLVKVGSQYFLLSASKDRVELVSEILEENAQAFLSCESAKENPFEATLKNFMTNALNKNKTDNNGNKSNNLDEKNM